MKTKRNKNAVKNQANMELSEMEEATYIKPR